MVERLKPKTKVSKAFFDEDMNSIGDPDMASWISITVFVDDKPVDQTLWKVEIVEESPDYFGKSKVYVKDPSKVPAGRTVQQGPKGGYYYETSSTLTDEEFDEIWPPEGEVDEHGLTWYPPKLAPPPPTFEELGLPYDLPEVNLTEREWSKGKEALADLDDVLEEEIRSDFDSNAYVSFADDYLESAYNNVKKLIVHGHMDQDRKMQIVNEFTFGNLLYDIKNKGLKNEKAMEWLYSNSKQWWKMSKSASGRLMKGIAKEFLTDDGIKPFEEGKEVDKHGVHDSYEITEEDYTGFKINYDYTQYILENADSSYFEMAGRSDPRKNGKVELWRGIGTESYAKWNDGGRPAMFPFKNDALSSWTSNMHKAKMFGKGWGSSVRPSGGLLLKKEIPFKKVYSCHVSNPALLGTNEEEFIIFGSKEDEASVSMEYESGRMWPKRWRSV